MYASPLRPYQERIVRFIVETPRCNVFAPMGAGKSLSVLTALERLAYVDDVYPVLVIAPKRVALTTWPDETRKWPHLRHLRVQAVLGTVAQRRAALQQSADIYTINYENAPWLIETLDDAWPFRTVVADESTRLKSFRLRQGSKRAQALSRVAFKSTRWLNLTGTPAPNGVIDCWGAAWFVDGGKRLGRSFTAFTDRWFRKGYDGYSLEPMPHAQREIEARLQDVSVSLDVSEFLQLPPLVENTIRVALPPSIREMYRTLEREFFVELEAGTFSADMALTRTSKLLQITAGGVYLDGDTRAWEKLHDEKLEALESVVEEAGGAPVLVAYHWKFELTRILERFGKRARHLDDNPQTIRDWNAGRIPVLCAHPASAGHGLNLQDGGNILVFLTSWWNLEEHQQIIERIGPTRQAQAGHNRPVFVHRIIAADTLDEDVLERLQGKATVQQALMRAMERRNG